MYMCNEKKDLTQFAKYFVLYKRDDKVSKKPSYRGTQLYDRIEYLNDKKEAKQFAMNNMPAMIGKIKMKNKNNVDLDYIVASKFEGKYKSHCGWDDTDTHLVTYDAVKCKKDEIESVINFNSSQEYFKKVELGIEVKLF